MTVFATFFFDVSGLACNYSPLKGYPTFVIGQTQRNNKTFFATWLITAELHLYDNVSELVEPVNTSRTAVGARPPVHIFSKWNKVGGCCDFSVWHSLYAWDISWPRQVSYTTLSAPRARAGRPATPHEVQAENIENLLKSTMYDYGEE